MSYSFKTSGWPERLWRTNNEADIARGNVPGSYQFTSFGECETTGASTNRVLWETGMPTQLTVPDSIQLTLVSTSASDTGVVKIRYLDGDLIERTEAVQLDGTTPVTTVATDIRAVNNAYYVDSATVAGTVTGTSGGIQYLRINIGEIQFNTSMQRIPAGKRLMITAVYGGSTSGTAESATKVKLETTFINGDSFADLGVLHPLAALGLQDNSTSLVGFPAIPIPSGEWVGFTFSTDKAANVSGGYFGYMENA
jgi:hypothetical protein